VSIPIENSYLQLVIHPERAAWDLRDAHDRNLSIQGATTGLSYRIGHTRFHHPRQDRSIEVCGRETVLSTHGELRKIVLSSDPDANGAFLRFEFALLTEAPLLLWRIAIENKGTKPIFLDRLEMLNIEQPQSTHRTNLHTVIPNAVIRNLQSPRFFSNGWGSWDYTGTYGPSDQFHRTRLGPLTIPMRRSPGAPQPEKAGHFVSEMFAVLGDEESRSGLLFGFLSQKEQFGIIETQLRGSSTVIKMWANASGARLNPGKSMETDWACLHFLNVDHPDPLSPYLQAVATEHRIEPDLSHNPWVSIPTGWCSWYEYMHDISAQNIRLNLKRIKEFQNELPLKIVQIDDGYQSMVGDWFDIKDTFPEGMEVLAHEIRDAGFTPGLWLAPFIVHTRSRLRREHPDWLIRGQLNRPANAGFSTWGGFPTGLDLTHPDALAYVQEVIRTVVEDWGYTYLKLDFLYAGALSGKRRDPTRTPAQVLRRGMESIREAAGEDVVLVGCGCPLGSAIGLVDAMRINPDVDRHWTPAMYGLGAILKSEPGMPSARNAIHNTLTRAFMHQRWWINDPDCLLLRTDMELTLAEVQSLATAIALSGGSILLSDDLTKLPPERLHIAQTMLPPIGKRPRVMDWFDSVTPKRVRLDLENTSGTWHLLSYFNWQDEPVDAELLLKDYALDSDAAFMVREFWSGKVARITDGVLRIKLPAHGVILLSVREATPDQPHYLGSNLHISQGLEVRDWQSGRGEVELCLEQPGRAEGCVVLVLPGAPREAKLGGKAVEWNALAVEGVYRFEVGFERVGWLRFIY